MGSEYIHGYDAQENVRLQDQAATLTELLHSDTHYPPGASVLEAGCGVGAQTITLARNSPEAMFTAVDIRASSVNAAKKRVAKRKLKNVVFEVGNIFELPYPDNHFDHVFVCFVLEHLADPVGALDHLKRLLKPGGTITVIEGDHGSTFFHPDSRAAHAAIACQVALQQEAGGNANIGRQLYPLLTAAGFTAVRVSPRMVYVDASRPELVEGFTRKTFTAMVKGVRTQALASGIIDRHTFEQSIEDLYRTTAHDGVFCYTFFKAFAKKT